MRQVVIGSLVAMWVGALGACGTQPEPEIRITRNFAAEINAEIEKIPEEDRAWPVYARAIEAMEPVPDAWWEDEAFNWPAEPGGALWDEVVAYLDRNAEALRLAHEASRKPRMGAPVEGSEVEHPAVWDTWATADGATDRALPELLFTASQRAASEGNSDAAEMMLDAMVGHSGHVAEVHSGAALVYREWAQSALLRVLRDRPELLKAEWLRSTAIALRGSDQRLWAERLLEHSRLKFCDYLQRAFTDDGAGDGELSPDAHDSIMRALNFMDADEELDPNRYPEASQNLGATSRSSMRDAAEWHWDKIRDRLWRPPWRSPIPDQRSPDLSDSHYAVIGKFDLAWGMLVKRTHLNRTRSGATVLAIEAELHRRAHGTFPASREEFSAEIRSQWPPDPFDGQPLRYTLRDGRPLIYSVGSDRDDDGGAPSSEGVPRHLNPVAWGEAVERDPDLPNDLDGDWVLFPPNPS